MENNTISYEPTIPPTKVQAEKTSAILHILAGMSIADARRVLKISDELLVRYAMGLGIPEDLRVDFPNAIDC